MDDGYRMFLLAMIVAVVTGLATAVIGSAATRSSWQADAVKHGCASYDPQTGEWGWKQ